MSELNFNCLPPEILIKVFGFLDVVSLKRATLTCQLWNNLIESGCRWSLELKYYVRPLAPRAEQKMNFVLTTNRKFGSIRVVNGSFSDDGQILQIFQRHGLNVVKLILDACVIDSPIALTELLNLTPNLTHVNIQSMLVRHEGVAPLDEVSPDLKKLRSLEIFKCDCRIIKCFRKAKLTTMMIEEDDSNDSKHYGPLVDFLCSQKMVTSLSVKSWVAPQLVLTEIGQLNVRIPFQLTKLAISHVGYATPQYRDNVLRFVESQSKNLEELELGSGIPNSVYECAFARMPKLNTLSVIVTKLPNNNDFYDRLMENHSVQTIEFRRRNLFQTIESRRRNPFSFWIVPNPPYLPMFLKKLRNIRHLVLPFVLRQNDLEAIAHNLEKIESLSIGSITDEHSIDGVKFPNIKTLNIGNLRCKINWNEFTKIHPRLAELTVATMEDASFLTSVDIDHITTNVDLQYIRLGEGICDILRDYSRNVLKLKDAGRA